MKVLKRVKIAYSIVSLTLLLYGFFLVVYPQLGIQWIYKIGGVLFIGIGIAKVTGYFSKDILQLAFQHDLAMGIVFYCNRNFDADVDKRYDSYFNDFIRIIYAHRSIAENTNSNRCQTDWI